MDDIARELTDLLDRARQGCPAAAQCLYDRYSGAVQRVVRRWLNQRLRRHYDSADFVQSVWASFFALPREGHFPDPRSLVAFLAKVAYNKVVKTTRQRLGTLRYDLSREVPLDEAAAPEAEWQLAAPTPTPSQHAQADERWQRLVQGLPPGYRRALELLRDGHTHTEIADRLGVDRSSIRRLLNRLQRRLDQAMNISPAIPADRAAPSESAPVAIAEPAAARAFSPNSRDGVLDRAYEEYHRRTAAGEALDLEAFCDGFPGYRSSLRRLFEADEMLLANPSVLEHDSLWEAPRLPESAWPRVGEMFGDFRLRRVLGKGAFARVYLATEASAGDRPVAVKLSTGGAEEARLQGRLHHGAIVPVLWAGLDRVTGLHVVCMPFLGGATLLDVLDTAFPNVAAAPPRSAAVIRAAIDRRAVAGDPAPDQQLAGPDLTGRSYPVGLAALGACLAEALAFLHGRGTAHCDIKPSNILLTPGGQPLLLDFNLARNAETARRGFGGTFAYMAPEAIRAWIARTPLPGPTAAAADVYSLGAVLYELLSGRPPAGAPPRGKHEEMARWALKNLELGVVPLRERNPAVPAALARLVERCLAPRAEDRPGAAEAAAALRALSRRRRLWPAVAVVALLIGAVAAAAAPRRAASPAEPAAVAAASHREEGRAQLARGWTELARGRADKAEAALRAADEAFHKAIERHKRDTGEKSGRWEDIFGRGRAAMLLGDLTQAQFTFTESRKARTAAMAAAAEEPRLLACRAYCLAAAGQHAAAIVLYEQAIDGGLRTAPVRNNLAYSYLGTADLKRADRLLKEAVRMAPDLRPALRNRAELALRVHRRAGPEARLPAWVLKDIDRVLAMASEAGQADPAELYLWGARAYARALADGESQESLSLAEQERLRKRVRELVERACVLGAPHVGLLRDTALKQALRTWLVAGRLPAARQAAQSALTTYLADPLGSALE